MALVPVNVPATHAWHAATVRPGHAPAPAPAPAGHVAVQIPSPHEAMPVGSLHEAIGARHAVRRFAARPVERAALDEVIAVGRAAHRWHWPTDHHGPLAMRILAAAFGVTDLAPGMYDEGDPLGAPEWLPRLKDMYAAAPVLLLICGDVISPWPGHAAGLFHAGAIGQAMWLSATRLRLAACAFGGTCADVTATVRRRDALLNHLFTIAMGYPAASLS